MSSVETNAPARWGGTLALAALAPIAWGSGYYVTETFLPPDRPLFGAMVRALPFGLLLLALRPRLPKGIWWWRALVLGTLNIGAFFVLIFIAAYRLPGGTAATLTATAPIMVMLVAWGLIGERPRVAVAGRRGRRRGRRRPAGAPRRLRRRPDRRRRVVRRRRHVVGGLRARQALEAAGRPAHLHRLAAGRRRPGAAAGRADRRGRAADAWTRARSAASSTSASPGRSSRTSSGSAACAELPAGAVSLVGLLNPVSGTIIGVVLAGESFGGSQALGLLMVLAGILAGQPAVIDRLRRRRSAGR